MARPPRAISKGLNVLVPLDASARDAVEAFRVEVLAAEAAGRVTRAEACRRLLLRGLASSGRLPEELADAVPAEIQPREWTEADDRAAMSAMARQHGPRAVGRLAQIMDDPTVGAGTAVAAAAELLDRGYGRATQPTQVSGEVTHHVLHVVTGVPRPESALIEHEERK